MVKSGSSGLLTQTNAYYALSCSMAEGVVAAAGIGGNHVGRGIPAKMG